MTNNNEEIVIQPNVIQIDYGFLKSLFWDYYCYIDKSNYTIDGILNTYKIPVKFLNMEYRKVDGDYVFCFLRCRKKYSKILLETIFPKLHNANIVLDGSDYINECEKAMNTLLIHLQEQEN